ncbi:MAG TPA: HAMP domain-containing sensor histidine kinase [Acidimicrobiia bacterium]|nr:HAMP domain-containing sensor histidine kinase [Acidimicrobiia bacterium]
MSPDLTLWVAGGIAAVSVAIVAWCLRLATAARAKERMARQEADDARHIKNDFVSMVSHELRTPLTSIAGFAQTLSSDWTRLSKTEIEEFLGYIAKQANYLGDLVEDVLVIPRLEAGRLRFTSDVFDLGEMIGEVAQMLFSTSGGGEAAVSIPHGVRVQADAKRVQQVIRNLLENARKYGGDQVLVEGLTHGEQYVVVVSDNGPGVPDGATNTIFEHFEQISKGDSRSSSGIGLGLPIARSLARAMGGDVWYERRFPTGSRFCFSLPADALVVEDLESSPTSEQDTRHQTSDVRLLKSEI